MVRAEKHVMHSIGVKKSKVFVPSITRRPKSTYHRIFFDEKEVGRAGRGLTIAVRFHYRKSRGAMTQTPWGISQRRNGRQPTLEDGGDIEIFFLLHCTILKTGYITVFTIV